MDWFRVKGLSRPSTRAPYPQAADALSHPPGIDGLPFYPARLYEPPGSPLHFFHTLRQDYIATYNDPIVQWTADAGRDSWIPLFTRLEMLFQLPVALFAAYRLGGRRAGTRGSDELLFLVYALETALTTLTCLHNVLWWDDAVYSAEVKNAIIFQVYGPWFIVRK